ncbi:jerky protein homolog-like [Megalopta genalis]|uniref:jerky protein homolog-like n=1 Tax=Megalopta genalis TaxID=115081 RepID=UPI001443657A|nr:jerky protein homolog-like [Megalopta genalis]XP_033331182.1 jerky protein homolog-like [Megalopta genalis]
MASKRKRVVLSIITKHEIIRKLESGESAAKLAKIYGIGKATITGIKNQKDAIENYLMQADTLDIAVNRKSMMVPKYKNVDDAVFQWFLENRDKGVPISGPILCEKALEFNEKLKGNPNFKASSGWLEKFKSRHGIRELNMSGEKLSTDNVTEENLTVDLHKFLIEKGYALQNMDNEDKRDITCTTLQQKNVTSQQEKLDTNSKVSKDHINAISCVNSTTCHQVPLLLFGKRKKLKSHIVYS